MIGHIERKSRIFIAAFSILLFTGCYYDHAEELYGTATCDTTNMTYTNTIHEIISRNGCLSCHRGTNSSGNISIDTYTGLKAKVTDGRLWGSLNHLPGFAAMPQGPNKINQCDLMKIKTWIDANTPQ